MKITDKEALKELKKVRSYELDEMVETYPENERDGRSDIQVVADEASWLFYKLNTDGWVPHEELLEARHILSKTRYGKVIPLDPRTLKPVYPEWQINDCKNMINEYDRIRNLLKRLKNKGICGQWS